MDAAASHDGARLETEIDGLEGVDASLVLLVVASGTVDDLGWLEAARARHVLVVVELAHALPDVLPGPTEGGRMVAAHGDGSHLIDELSLALCGAALDPANGALTGRSLADYLRHRCPGVVLQGPWTDAILADAPPLERLWRVGLADHSIRPTTPPARSDDDPDRLLGAVLPGRFRIEQRLAAGSFGTIYRARQLSIERDVAVKVLRPGLDPFSEDGRLFVQEIQAVGRIDHRNVVRVYQADITADGRLFFAMELLDGRDLRALAASGPPAAGRIIALGRQLLDALQAAHQQGLVHADVKPANMVVVPDGRGDRLVLLDFGLTRLRRDGMMADSVGGTPAYMAPEQLRHGRLDARSDLFSAALVLLELFTGWRRQRASEVVPSPAELAKVSDADCRRALTRALALDPGDRFESAAAFAAALSGEPERASAVPARPPFQGLVAFDRGDHDRFHGRGRELAELTALALHRRLLVVTAPSGVGKTSLLRAGLVARLEALSIPTVYASCRADDEAVLADARVPRVLVIDQVETALAADDPRAEAHALVDSAIAWSQRSDGAVNTILSVREDHLARLLERLGGRLDLPPIFRVGPLGRDGARAAIRLPLASQHLDITSELLEALLDDLVRAGRVVGRELGWATADPIYTPHLQLVCTTLLARLPADEAVLTLPRYLALGGFDAIVGEHLDRVLDGLETADAGVARDLFLALVTGPHDRSTRTEEELVDLVAPPHRERVPRVLDLLRQQGLVVRSRRPDGELIWELVHDSLVPRVLAWIDRRDLDRRRAVELLRFHLRRSRAGPPSLLSRPELRELARHPTAVSDLERERAGNIESDPGGWTPRALMERSRQVQRRTTLAAIALVATVIAGVGAAVVARWQAARDRRVEAARRERNLGPVRLEMTAFDWDPIRSQAILVDLRALPHIAWSLHAPSTTDPDTPGAALAAERLIRHSSAVAPGGDRRIDEIEAPGGDAFLVVHGRGRSGESCPEAVVPLRALPGYEGPRKGATVVNIVVPTCRATLAGTLEIPAGRFVFGGVGSPPSDYQAEFPERASEAIVDVPAFRIDRTEVTNAAFAVFASMQTTTGVGAPAYIPNPDLARAAEPASPVSGITWREARAYCRFLGKRLATSVEWEKAMRGGLQLDTADNPDARRNFPWGGSTATPGQANLADSLPKGIKPVGSHPSDRSPYGVVDLAGNVGEWIGSPPTGTTDAAEFFRGGWRMTRGGNWSETPSHDLANFTAIENARVGDSRSFTLGLRCAL